MNECRSVGTTRCRVALPLGRTGPAGGGGGGGGYSADAVNEAKEKGTEEANRKQQEQA